MAVSDGEVLDAWKRVYLYPFAQLSLEHKDGSSSVKNPTSDDEPSCKDTNSIVFSEHESNDANDSCQDLAVSVSKSYSYDLEVQRMNDLISGNCSDFQNSSGNCSLQQFPDVTISKLPTIPEIHDYERKVKKLASQKEVLEAKLRELTENLNKIISEKDAYIKELELLRIDSDEDNDHKYLNVFSEKLSLEQKLCDLSQQHQGQAMNFKKLEELHSKDKMEAEKRDTTLRYYACEIAKFNKNQEIVLLKNDLFKSKDNANDISAFENLKEVEGVNNTAATDGITEETDPLCELSHFVANVPKFYELHELMQSKMENLLNYEESLKNLLNDSHVKIEQLNAEKCESEFSFNELIDKHDCEKNDLLGKIQSLEDKCCNFEADADRKIDSIHSNSTNISENIEDILLKLKSYEDKVTSLKNDLIAKQQVIITNDKVIYDLKRDFCALEDSIRSLKVILSTKESEIESFKSDKFLVDIQLSTVKSEKIEVEKSLSKLKRDMSCLSHVQAASGCKQNEVLLSRDNNSIEQCSSNVHYGQYRDSHVDSETQMELFDQKSQHSDTLISNNLFFQQKINNLISERDVWRKECETLHSVLDTIPERDTGPSLFSETRNRISSVNASKPFVAESLSQNIKRAKSHEKQYAYVQSTARETFCRKRSNEESFKSLGINSSESKISPHNVSVNSNDGCSFLQDSGISFSDESSLNEHVRTSPHFISTAAQCNKPETFEYEQRLVFLKVKFSSEIIH